MHTHHGFLEASLVRNACSAQGLEVALRHNSRKKRAGHGEKCVCSDHQFATWLAFAADVKTPDAASVNASTSDSPRLCMGCVLLFSLSRGQKASTIHKFTLCPGMVQVARLSPRWTSNIETRTRVCKAGEVLTEREQTHRRPTEVPRVRGEWVVMERKCAPGRVAMRR